MSRKIFSSFAEIDQQLEILSIEKELQIIKLRQSGSKTLSSLSPSSLLMDSLGSFGAHLRGSGALQKLLIMFVVKKFFR
jgi:hypothetical protein